MRKQNIIAMLSLLCIGTIALSIGGCTEPQVGSSTSSSDLTSEVVVKENRQVSLKGDEIKKQYFLNDTIEVSNVDLEFYNGALESERFEVIKPDGSISTDTALTFDTVGTYTFKFYLELYKEIIYAEQAVEVVEWADSYAELDLLSVDCRDTYCEGNTFFAPEIASLDYFGNTVIGQYSCSITPSGEEIFEDIYHLETPGEYKLKFTYEFGDRMFYGYKTFLCNNESFSIIGTETTANYGIDGVNLNLKEGETFFVNRVIDLSKTTRADTLIAIQLNPQSQAEEKGLPDAMIINFTFTDIYDDSNSFTISLRKRWDLESYREWADPQSYLYAAASEQQFGGFNNGTFNTTGYLTDFSMVGKPIEKTLFLMMDYESRSIYTTNSMTTDVKVADLDDENVYNGKGDYDKVLWSGFKTGECYLSITAEDYRSANKMCNINIKSILGVETLAGEKVHFASGEEETMCNLGENISLSDREIIFGGESYSAMLSGYYTPSNEFIETNEISLMEEGTYRVVYTTNVEDKPVFAIHSIHVADKKLVLDKPLFGAYPLNSTFIVPNGQVKLLKENYATEVSIVKPDGTIVNETTLTLDQEGTYQLKYAVVGAMFTFEEVVRIQALNNVPYATGNDESTMIDNNAAISGGWGNGMLGMDIVAGDSVTINQVIDWSTDAAADTGAYQLFYFCMDNWTAQEYVGKSLEIKLTNAENASDYLRFEILIGEDSLIDINIYDESGALLSSIPFVYMTAKDTTDLATKMIAFKINKDILTISGHSVDRKASVPLDFEKAVVTIGTQTGISVDFRIIGNAMDWQ